MLQIDCEIASGRWGKCKAGVGNESKNDIVDDTHDVHGRILGEAGLVFVQSNIPAVMQTILDLPVGAQHFQ